jgi:hypothetical protein
MVNRSMRGPGVVVLVALLRLTRAAAAAEGDGAAAPANGGQTRQALLDRAQAERAAGRHAEALAAAQAAGAIKMTSSLRRFLAEELLALDRPARAYDQALRCADEAAEEPPSPNHDAVRVGCRGLLRELAGVVALVSLDLGASPPAGLVVTAGGEAVDLTVSVHAFTPGPVRVRATAPGAREVVRDVELVAGTARVLVLRLEPVVVAAAAPPPVIQGAPVAAAPPPGGGAGLSRGPVVVGSAGALALATALVLHEISDRRYHSFLQRCMTAPCSPSDPDRAAIDRLDTAAQVSLAAGLGLAAAAAVWQLWPTPRPRRPPVAGSVQAAISPRAGIFGLAVRF